MRPATLVLDVGKTHAKASLVGLDGAVLATRTRVNQTRTIDDRSVLDADAIEAWILATLGDFSRLSEVEAIVPVGHGAAAALVRGDGLAAPVLDYEQAPSQDVSDAYDHERDPFEETQSPRLPFGLNLGRQLFWQDRLYGDRGADSRLLLWPQYWVWRLSGEMAAEVSSLGCHTDLWRPQARDYSDLAHCHGWIERLGPLRKAGAVLGAIRPSIAATTGLPKDCVVLCGLHDSNASLHAIRASPTVAGKPFSLVSTGTWFVAFQVGGSTPALDPRRDTLANVDIAGDPVPSARFMGGREYAAILDGGFGVSASMADVERIVRRGVMTIPSFVPCSGPFPNSRGRIVGDIHDLGERAALAALHLALMTDASLDLIGADGPVAIEGRFAGDKLYPALLAALRPHAPVMLSEHGDGVARGAARLWTPLAEVALQRVEAAPIALDDYARRWRAAAEACSDIA